MRPRPLVNTYRDELLKVALTEQLWLQAPSSPIRFANRIKPYATRISKQTETHYVEYQSVYIA